MLRMVLLSLLAFSVTACRPVWTAQTIPACYAPSGAPELDRERSYLAALLALEARGYAILHAEAPVQLEAEYKSSYKPEKAHAHWLIDVLPDASLHVDSVPAGVPQAAEAWDVESGIEPGLEHDPFHVAGFGVQRFASGGG